VNCPTEATTEEHEKKASPAAMADCIAQNSAGAHLLVEAADPADQIVRNEQAHNS